MEDNHNPVIEGLSHVLHRFKSALSEAMAAEGLALAPVEFKLLRTIAQMSPCSAQAVALRVERDKARVTRVVQRLLELGAVSREPNPEDGRSQLLQLTPRGEALMVDARRVEKQVMKRCLQGLDAGQREQLLSCLGIMRDNLRRD